MDRRLDKVTYSLTRKDVSEFLIKFFSFFSLCIRSKENITKALLQFDMTVSLSLMSGRAGGTKFNKYSSWAESMLNFRATLGVYCKQCNCVEETVTDMCSRVCQPSCYTSSAGDDCAEEMCSEYSQGGGNTNMNDEKHKKAERT